MRIEDIEFILSHFEEPLFPRKMMTSISNGQFSVTSKEEILQRCRESNYIDCRINAYPEYTEYKGIVRQPPNFVFIDLDKSRFSKYKDPKKMLDFALKNTLKKLLTISQEIKPHAKHNQSPVRHANPTVLWSGNGYHVYVPIQATVLEHYDQFSKDRFPSLFSPTGKYLSLSLSEVFLKFAKDHFTDAKADSLYHPRYRSCLVRFPNTLNSKCLGQGLSNEASKVKIIQKWDGHRLPIQLLTKEFRRWITQEEINEKKRAEKKPYLSKSKYAATHPNNHIYWIENLLQTPVEDHRKFCLWRIVIPYLVNIRRLPSEEAAKIASEWLQKCDTLRKLDFNPHIYTQNDLKRVKEYLPSSKETLKQNQTGLYDIFIAKNIL